MPDRRAAGRIGIACDVLAMIGLGSVGAGAWTAFGWPTAAIIVGVALLALGLYGASRCS